MEGSADLLTAEIGVHSTARVPGESEENAALRMVRRWQSNLAVVDSDGAFVGLVPSHRLIGRLLAQHDEDAARLGGYLASSGRARLAAEEPVSRRLLHRLPWLLVGLVGAMASAVVVGAFEAQLKEVVLLAFFVPALVAMYVADLIGRLDSGLDWVRYASVFKYYGNAIEDGIEPLAFCGVTLAAIGLATFGAWLFDRRDLAA